MILGIYTFSFSGKNSENTFEYRSKVGKDNKNVDDGWPEQALHLEALISVSFESSLRKEIKLQCLHVWFFVLPSS